MNNYQAQQFWDDMNGVIGFLTSIIFLGFIVGMTKDWIGEIAMKEPYTIHPWLYDKFGGKKLQDAPWEERYKVAQRIGAQLDLEYNIPCKAQKVGTVEIPIDYWNKNKDHVADVLDEITGIKHMRPWRKELPEYHSSSNIATSQEVEGTCYEDAWRFLIKEEEGELIHGTVESLGKRIGHAWVELPTGFIWEPQTKGYFSIKDFDIAASPIEEHRYSVEEAAIMLSRVGKHGPWTDEERAKWLSSGKEMKRRLVRVAIEREPLKMAKQLGYDVHRLSPKDIIDKGDYALGYRFRLSKTKPGQPFPEIVLARSESEVASFLKREIERK